MILAVTVSLLRVTEFPPSCRDLQSDRSACSLLQVLWAVSMTTARHVGSHDWPGSLADLQRHSPSLKKFKSRKKCLRLCISVLVCSDPYWW